jgi:hypothetical protein
LIKISLLLFNIQDDLHHLQDAWQTKCRIPLCSMQWNQTAVLNRFPAYLWSPSDLFLIFNDAMKN